MIVADTSALISLATGEILETVLEEFDLHTTAAVIGELERTATYEDRHGTAAETVLVNRNQLTVHTVDDVEFSSSRIDEGEASCIGLARRIDAEFVLTDDLRALPELQTLVDARIAISPIVLKALVKRGVLDEREAKTRLERIAENRDWLGAPIYRRAAGLFE